MPPSLSATDHVLKDARYVPLQQFEAPDAGGTNDEFGMRGGLEGPHTTSQAGGEDSLTTPNKHPRAASSTFEDRHVSSQRNTRPQRMRSFPRIVSDYWLIELLCWLLSLALLAAIIGILLRFDGQNIPKWRYGITLGALVSLFATLATFTMAVPLGASLGQLKWIWFRNHDKPIVDYQTIERASNGPLGSCLLLIRWNGGLLAIAGALLTILTLAVNPFVQQVIKNESRLVNTTQASLPIAVKYDTTGNLGQASLDIDLPMKAAIMDGLLNLNAPANQFAVKSDCSTGNCTWPTYQTLAVCSACSDLTSRLTTTLVEDPSNNNSSSSNATLPNGLSLVTPWYKTSQGLFSMTMNNTVNTDYGILRSIAFPETEDNFPLIDFFSIIGPYNTSGANVTQIGPYAAECVLRFCVQSYSASESNGTFQEIPNGEARLLNFTSEIYHNQSEPQDYQAYYNAANDLNIYLAQTFVGAFQGQNSLSGTISFPSDVTQAIFQALNSTPHTLDSVMSNVAKSMTLDMRTRADAGDPVLGNAAAEQSFVHIEWAWLSLPLALLVLVLVFLLVVFVTTRRLGLEPWKNSSLATLFHGLDHAGRQRVMTSNVEEDMAEVAQGLMVRMEVDDHGWALRSVG